MADLSELTRIRRDALAKIVERCSADGALLFLMERSLRGLFIAPAYAVGSLEGVADKVSGKSLFIDQSDFKLLSEDTLKQDIRRIILDQGWHSGNYSNSVGFFLHHFMIDDKITENIEKINAYLLIERLDGRAVDPPLDYLTNLNALLASSRDKRFKDAILKLHPEIMAAISGKEALSQRVSHLIANEIGAQGFSQEPCRPFCQNEVLFPRSCVLQDAIIKNCSTQKISDLISVVDISNDRMNIPQKEISYQLRSIKFNTFDGSDDNFDRVSCCSQVVSFEMKKTEDYFQTYFSESDWQLADSIFNFVRGFIDLEKKEHAAAQLLVLEQKHGYDAEIETDVIPEISRDANVIGLVEIQIDISGENVVLDHEVIFGSVNLSDEYLSRIRAFCRTFYFNGKDCESMQIGVDVKDDQVFHEFHMPSDSGQSRIYIIVYSSVYVPCGTYHTVLTRMESHFLRLKRRELLLSRSNFMTESRHSVIQYFSVARDCLDLIKVDWDAGLRNKDAWMALLQDEGLRQLLDNANWAINHANLILETGRFLVRDIDSQSINKKNTNIEDIIQNCMRVLEFQRRRKGISWHQKVEGRRPSRVYADAVLLQIALLNLFDNAVKYAPNNSSIRWTLSYGLESYRFSLINLGDHIDAERFNLLLRIGYRGRQRDQLNVRPGTGIGLPVANKILIAHAPSARLKLNSEVESDGFWGGVNTFYFDMPYLTGVERQDRNELTEEGRNGT